MLMNIDRAVELAARIQNCAEASEMFWRLARHWRQYRRWPQRAELEAVLCVTHFTAENVLKMMQMRGVAFHHQESGEVRIIRHDLMFDDTYRPLMLVITGEGPYVSAVAAENKEPLPRSVSAGL